MQEPLPFDPNVYYGMVADNLLRNFGTHALFMADQALQKMKALGDSEGFDIWLSIHEHLNAKATEAALDEGAVIH